MSKELEHIDERLKDIESKLQSLDDQSHRLEEQKKSLMLRKVELVHGVTVGTIVTYRGVEHRVVHVDTRYGDKPWLEGTPKKKDGTWGTARRNLYSHWEKVS